MSYTNWHDGRKPGAPFNRPSPNVRAILEYCHKRWGMTDLGCYTVRMIRGGTRWSAHAFGAAQDLSYRQSPSREVIENEVIPFLEENAEALNIQRIHDYYARRYWQVGRGWINRPPGGRNDHLHIETNEEGWDDGRSVEERLKGAPKPKPAPKKRPMVQNGDTGAAVKQMQTILRSLKYKNSSGKRLLVVDGVFGNATEKAVREFQADNPPLKVDGICGKNTWAALLDS